MAVRVGMVSLGCTKNLLDSEVMLGLLIEKGYEITPDEEQAEILIVNTCAFIEAAKRESLDTIFQLIHSNKNTHRKIIVAGCLVQRYGDQLLEELGNGIHGLVGVSDFPKIADACDAVLAEKGFFRCISKPPNYLYDHHTPRLRTTPSHFAYVKIAEGCDNRCSYCVIPNVRGRYRSRKLDSVVSEVCSLAKSGVREVNLIAQDTTYYGQDLRDGSDLISLLKELVLIHEIKWIRILYGHPAHITNELLELMASEEKICSYIDIPVQHIHDEILKKMGRRINQAQIYGLIDKIRRIIPDVILRTSLIVGFPGETERHFNELMQFVKQVEFDHLGVFIYSPEEGTKAADMPDQVPESVKQERMDRIAELHEGIAMRKRQRFIGRQEVVLVDRAKPLELWNQTFSKFEAIGRTQGQAPEIDDVVYMIDGEARVGDFVKVKIIDTCGPYDLMGSVVK